MDWCDAGLPLTPATHTHTHEMKMKAFKQKGVRGLIQLLERVVNDLVDVEVSHPEDNRAGHELSLGSLGGRWIE